MIVDIPDDVAKKFAKWASVQRTLDNAFWCAEELQTKVPAEGEHTNAFDKAAIAIDELPVLAKILDVIHQEVRKVAWESPVKEQ